MTHFQCCKSYTGLVAHATCPKNIGKTLFSISTTTKATTTKSTIHKIANKASFHTSVSQQRKSHYEKLGLSMNATKKEIKTQFYKLSKLHHPDKSASEESRKKFLDINEAYSVLGDDRQRRDYDLTQLDKSGTLYSDNDSSSRHHPNRGTLRRTPFRHSRQSAAAAAEAAAAARNRSPFRPNFGEGVPHFDSKSHQEMHYEQDIRREKRRQERQRASAEQKQDEESDSPSSRIINVFFVFLAIMMTSSFIKTYADEGDDREQDDLDHNIGGRYNRVLYSHHQDNNYNVEKQEDDGSGSDDLPSTIISAIQSRSRTFGAIHRN